MAGPGRNAKNADEQGESTNVVPFPGSYVRDWIESREDLVPVLPLESPGPRDSPGLSGSPGLPGLSDPVGADRISPPTHGHGIGAGAGKSAVQSEGARLADQQFADTRDDGIFAAGSFWDGDSEWLHQPIAGPADPTQAAVPGSPRDRPAPAAGVDDGRAAGVDGRLVAGVKGARSPSRRRLIGWCVAIVAALIVLGGVLPRILPEGSDGGARAAAVHPVTLRGGYEIHPTGLAQASRRASSTAAAGGAKQRHVRSVDRRRASVKHRVKRSSKSSSEQVEHSSTAATSTPSAVSGDVTDTAGGSSSTAVNGGSAATASGQSSGSDDGTRTTAGTSNNCPAGEINGLTGCRAPAP